MQPGDYYANVKEAVTTTAKNGNPQLAVKVEITHIAENGQWVDCINAERTIYLSLTDAAWPYTKAKLEVMKFNGDFDNPRFASEGFSVVMTTETYEGKVREKWEVVWGGVEKEKADTDQIRRLNALWRAEMHPETGPKKRPAAPPPPKPAADDSSIPF